MRVLFVTPFYYPELNFGGPAKRLHGMARALRNAGADLRVVTIDSENNARRDEANYDGITTGYVPWIGRALNALPIRPQRLRAEIASAAVVHCFGLYNFICPLAVDFARRAGKPVLLEPMGMYVPRVRTILLKRIYNALITRWMAKHVSAIIATSPIEAEELKSVGRFAQVVVRRNGLDVAEFAAHLPREMMRKRWGIAPTGNLILNIGRISEKKQLRELVAAFIQADVRPAKLVIAGPISEPRYAELVRKDINCCSRRDDILLTDALYEDDLKAALSAADLFVMPSLNENFGNAAAEAVAAGVPVLLTETCGIAPMIHGRAGLAVGVGVEQLANGIREMLKPEVRSRMTARREEVKRELSWDEPIAQTIALYERIVSLKY